MKKLSKKRKVMLEKFDKQEIFSAEAGIKLMKELATANFDESVELHVNLGVDSRHADQQGYDG